MSFDKRRERTKQIARQIRDNQFSDQTWDFENKFFHDIFDQYVFLFKDELVEYIKTMMEHADLVTDFNENENGFLSKVNDEILIINGDVSMYRNFIIKMTHDVLHIRELFNEARTDYKDDNQHINHPNFQWYKDREFNFEYDKDLHGTKLGGIYGDCRDSNFVLTMKKFISFPEDDPYDYDEIEEGGIYSYNLITELFYNIRIITNKIKNGALD